MRFWIIAVGCVTLAGAAHAADPAGGTVSQQIPDLFGMDQATFGRELERRFQYPPPQPLPPEVSEPRRGQSLDAEYFRSFPEFDRSYSPAARARAEELAARLAAEAGSLTHEQFVLRVAEIAALADNAHTAIDENALRKNTPRVPIRTFLFADGLHVLRASPELADLLGSRIERIESRSVEDVYRRLARYLPGPERRRRLQLIPVLESPALLHAAGLARERSSLGLTLRLPDGRLVERRIAAEERGLAAPVMSTVRLLFPSDRETPMLALLRDPAAAPVSLRNSRELFTLQPFGEGGLYIRLSHNADGDEEPIAPFLELALRRVAGDKPRFIVVDMRMNGGGDYTATYDFARSLPRAAAGAPIYVLTSPWTFSAAITTVAALKDAGGKQVLIAGEAVGDRLDFWAEGGTFDLPNSAIRVHYSAGRHNYAGPCADRQTCFWLNELYPVRVDDLDPDIAAPLTFDAYSRLADPALDAISERERRRLGDRG